MNLSPWGIFALLTSPPMIVFYIGVSGCLYLLYGINWKGENEQGY